MRWGNGSTRPRLVFCKFEGFYSVCSSFIIFSPEEEEGNHKISKEHGRTDWF